jgi:hypothetical protein
VSIDHNRNGEIDKTELKTAFSKSGVTVSNAKLDEFFADVDTNKDGVITYPEWRYVLLANPLRIFLTNLDHAETSSFSSPAIRPTTCTPSCHTTRPRAT